MNQLMDGTEDAASISADWCLFNRKWRRTFRDLVWRWNDDRWSGVLTFEADLWQVSKLERRAVDFVVCYLVDLKRQRKVASCN